MGGWAEENVGGLSQLEAGSVPRSVETGGAMARAAGSETSKINKKSVWQECDTSRIQRDIQAHEAHRHVDVTYVVKIDVRSRDK